MGHVTERERMGLERDEKKLVQEIKKCAKQNQMVRQVIHMEWSFFGEEGRCILIQCGSFFTEICEDYGEGLGADTQAPGKVCRPVRPAEGYFHANAGLLGRARHSGPQCN